MKLNEKKMKHCKIRLIPLMLMACLTNANPQNEVNGEKHETKEQKKKLTISTSQKIIFVISVALIGILRVLYRRNNKKVPRCEPLETKFNQEVNSSFQLINENQLDFTNPKVISGAAYFKIFHNTYYEVSRGQYLEFYLMISDAYEYELLKKNPAIMDKLTQDAQRTDIREQKVVVVFFDGSGKALNWLFYPRLLNVYNERCESLNLFIDPQQRPIAKKREIVDELKGSRLKIYDAQDRCIYSTLFTNPQLEPVDLEDIEKWVNIDLLVS